MLLKLQESFPLKQRAKFVSPLRLWQAQINGITAAAGQAVGVHQHRAGGIIMLVFSIADRA